MRVSRLNRFVSVAILVPFLAATSRAASGEIPNATAELSAPQPSGQSERQAAGKDTMAAGLLEGEMMADSVGTGGKVGLGLGVGVLTGLIGTGIGYAVTGPASMTPEALQRYSSGGSDYQLGFKTAWEKKSKSKKRNSFLVGGLLGTAAWFAILGAATSDN